jgi:hypothetical protein
MGPRFANGRCSCKTQVEAKYVALSLSEPSRRPLCCMSSRMGEVAPMSFLAELHQLPAMAALSSDARRRFVLAYVTRRPIP